MALSDNLLATQQVEPQPHRRGAFAFVVFSALLGASVAVCTALVVTTSGATHAIDLADVRGTVDFAATGSDIAVVREMFGVWGTGGYTGSEAMANAEKLWTKDAVLDFRANIDEPLYKLYVGRAGVLELCQHLLSLKFVNFAPTVLKGPGDTVISRNSYSSVLLSTATESMPQTDFLEFQLTGGKISHVKAFWGDQKMIAEQWATETIGPVSGMFRAWATGMFSGPNAGMTAANFFTADTMVDATAEIRGTDKYKIYNGIDGVLEWCQFLANFQFHEFTPTFFSGPQRDIVMAQNTYGMTYKPTGKSAAGKVSDMMLVKVVDGKISYMKFFWGAPSITEGLMN